MGLPGRTDSSIYTGLKDVLQRDPVVTTVTYEPDSIIKRFLRAHIDPDRLIPPTGPGSPTLDVEWRFVDDEHYYRIHYVDPNTGFNCGWHCDENHSNLGPVHFQYDAPEIGESDHERAKFDKNTPTEILWTALDRLFETRIPTLTSED